MFCFVHTKKRSCCCILTFNIFAVGTDLAVNYENGSYVSASSLCLFASLCLNQLRAVSQQLFIESD